MPRIRTIKPEFWVDEKVVELDPWARLLFIGLWNFADDQGFIEYSPKRIKMQIFPGDTTDVAPLLASLLEAGLLAAYDSPIGRVLHIPGWTKHQKVSNPASPRFDVADLRPLHQTDDQPREASRAVQSPLVGKERKGKEEEGKGNTLRVVPPPADDTLWPDPEPSAAAPVRTSRARDKPPGNPEANPDFMAWWRVYPNPQKRPDTYRAWLKAVAKVAPSELLELTTAYADAERRRGTEQRYIPHSSTWLNQERWRDPLPRTDRPAGHQPYRNPEDTSIYEGAL